MAGQEANTPQLRFDGRNVLEVPYRHLQIIGIYICMYIYIYTYIYMCVCIYVCVCVCVCVCMCVCMSLYMFIYLIRHRFVLKCIYQ